MALLEEYFYHAQIEKYIGVFGSVFDNIHIERDDKRRIRVPISLAPKQMYVSRNIRNETPDRRKTNPIVLPAMYFELTSWQKDSNRALTQFTRKHVRSENGSVKSQYNRVPYNFNFQLRIRTRYFDDLLQVFEQIAVSVDPSVQIEIVDNKDIDQNAVVHMKLESSEFDVDNTGSFEEQNHFEAVFNFVLEGYLYRKTSPDGKIITKVIVNYHDYDTKQFIERDVIEP